MIIGNELCWDTCSKNQREEANEMEDFEIRIEWHVTNAEQLKEIVKIVSEIQKEHRCNCTLSVKQD